MLERDSYAVGCGLDPVKICGTVEPSLVVPGIVPGRSRILWWTDEETGNRTFPLPAGWRLHLASGYIDAHGKLADG